MSKPTLLFMPGAWHSPSCFDKLRAALSASDHRTEAVTLASVGVQSPAIDSHTRDVAAIHQILDRLIKQEGKQVIVVAHSYGGLPGSGCVKDYEARGDASASAGAGAKSNPGIVGVIFLAAFLAEVGESLIDVANPSRDPDGAPLMAPEPDAETGEYAPMQGELGLEFVFLKGNPAYINWYRAEHWLYADMSDAQAQQAIEALRPHAALATMSKAESAAWHHVPCTYIGCERDPTVPPTHQESMLKKVKSKSKYPWTFTSIDSDHSPFMADTQIPNLKAIIEDHVQVIQKQW